MHLSPGRAGEHIVREGFSSRSFCQFLANYASRAIEKGKTPAELAKDFAALAAGNASQVRQILVDLIIESPELEAELTSTGARKQITLSKFWGTAEIAARPDLSELDI